MLSDEKKDFQCRSAGAAVNSRTGSAENGIPELGDSFRALLRTQWERTHRINTKQGEISDMDARATRRWEKHQKIEIHGRMNCLRNNNRKIRVLKNDR